MLGAPLHILEVVLLDNDAFFLEDAIRVVLALGVNVEDFVVEALADIYNDGVIIFCVSLYCIIGFINKGNLSVIVLRD